MQAAQNHVRRPSPTWDARWRRRAISLPILFGAAALTFAVSPVLLFTTGLIDLVSKRRVAFSRSRTVLFALWLLACEVFGVLAAGALWVSHLATGSLAKPSFIEANAALQRVWTRAIFGAAIRLFGMSVRVEGYEETERGPFLLFVRHVSTADTVIAAALIANPRKLLVRYVLKRELAWDPCLDIVGHRLPNVFVDRSGKTRDAELERVASLAKGLDDRSAVLIYPEGTRFTPKKHAAAIAKLDGAGESALSAIAREYKNVLPPKLGGPLALLANAPGVDVVFVEHTGFEDVTSLKQIWRGALAGRTLRVRLRRVSASQIPAQARETWLFEEWRTMDHWVEQERTDNR